MFRSGKNNPLLYPAYWLYRCGVGLRNLLFDRGLIKQHSFPIPIICVGNITVGGTGKTPHIELLISMLSSEFRIAVISRGYKRRSRGLREVSLTATAREVGDEPKQIKQKFPQVRVIVDGNRRRAVNYLLQSDSKERPEVILLDDGFQHRYIKPSFSILLVDARRELHEDKLLPIGNLREAPTGRYRADCIIVTKCPKDFSPISRRIIRRNLAPYPHQRVFFSDISYGILRHISSLSDKPAPSVVSGPLPGSRILALSGIASPEPFLHQLSSHYTLTGQILFPDHHYFTAGDLAHIHDKWKDLVNQAPEQPLYIICTEKDAVRLLDRYADLDPTMTNYIYVLPITSRILYKPEDFQKMVNLAIQPVQ